MSRLTRFCSNVAVRSRSLSRREKSVQQASALCCTAKHNRLNALWGGVGLVLLLSGGVAAQPTHAAEPLPSNPSALPSSPAYRIGPEDVLEISVWREEELHREVLVRPDGGISFPLAGDIQVAGRTPAEVQIEITNRIKKFIPEAVVTVSAKKISGYTIFVIGRVNKPGQFVVGRYVDVVQALTLAGGLSPYAAEEKIKVLRRKDGVEHTLPFNYSEVKKGNKLSQNILLQSGDVVVVP